MESLPAPIQILITLRNTCPAHVIYSNRLPFRVNEALDTRKRRRRRKRKRRRRRRRTTKTTSRKKRRISQTILAGNSRVLRQSAGVTWGLRRVGVAAEWLFLEGTVM